MACRLCLGTLVICGFLFGLYTLGIGFAHVVLSRSLAALSPVALRSWVAHVLLEVVWHIGSLLRSCCGIVLFVFGALGGGFVLLGFHSPLGTSFALLGFGRALGEALHSLLHSLLVSCCIVLWKVGSNLQ